MVITTSSSMSVKADVVFSFMVGSNGAENLFSLKKRQAQKKPDFLNFL
jgi:hypothetical protein